MKGVINAGRSVDTWTGSWNNVHIMIQSDITRMNVFFVNYFNTDSISTSPGLEGMWWYSNHTQDENLAFEAELARVQYAVDLLNSGTYSSFDPAEFCKELLG